ncbi:MAG: hypothetical protein RMZ41_000485 [Nostoc sp. DedVER02]|nr:MULTISPECIES: hypothetical protein [unclassified Nostoc]MDZ7987972.1 hypothetical protein [Nostoc sp. DedVER02]MDZ8114896.1 hypothetical protein [Nostoc sp. DedVER01b]
MSNKKITQYFRTTVKASPLVGGLYNSALITQHSALFIVLAYIYLN